MRTLVPSTPLFRSTEVSQDTWILFPWDTEAQFIAPIAKGQGK
jgi:hypothetical protein